jgi:hypothetical protein
MSFESCFGGFAGSKSASAAMGGEPTLWRFRPDDASAPIAAIERTRRSNWQHDSSAVPLMLLAGAEVRSIDGQKRRRGCGSCG